MASDGRPVVLGAGAAGALLVLCAPPPAAAIAVLSEGALTADPTAPVLAVVALAAWALAAWLGVVVLVTSLGRLPGLPGRACAAVARRTAPSAVRRAVEVALGLGLATGALGAGPASAVTVDGHAARQLPGATSAPAPAGPERIPIADQGPGPAPATGPVGSDSLDWPRTAAPDVVVQPGDTLWGLAEQALRATASAPPSDTAVAHAWPAWWAANRQVIGEDPDLILPGTVLSPPPTTGGPP